MPHATEVAKANPVVVCFMCYVDVIAGYVCFVFISYPRTTRGFVAAALQLIVRLTSLKCNRKFGVQ